MMKSIAIVVASAQAVDLTSETPTRDLSGFNEKGLYAPAPTPETTTRDLNGFDNKNLYAPTPETDSNTKMMLGSWSAQMTCSDSDVQFFSAWQPEVEKFLGDKKYPQFIPVSYTKQIVNGTNYRVVFDVTPKDSNGIELLHVVMNVPFPSGGVAATQGDILSIITPDGLKHETVEGLNSSVQMPGGVSNWIKDIPNDLADTFIGYKQKILEYSGKNGEHTGYYQTQFRPIQYKKQVVNGLIYTIQYQVADDKIIQATVAVPTANRLRNGGVIQVTQEPSVTQFVDVDGTVTGAFKLGASIATAATLLASVMLA